MTDPKSAVPELSTPPAPPVKRSTGHRAVDVRDAVAEMAAKAQEISLEARSRMGDAMKELIAAAAGLAGFAVESARDLVQFMVRRGQMTQEEADKLMKEVEASQPKRKPVAPMPVKNSQPPAAAAPVRKPAAAAPPLPEKKPAPRVEKAAKKTAAKVAVKAPAKKSAAKKVAPKKTAPAKAAKKASVKKK